MHFLEPPGRSGKRPKLTLEVWQNLKPTIPPHFLTTAKSEAWVLGPARDLLLEFTKINSVHSQAQNRALFETDDVILDPKSSVLTRKDESRETHRQTGEA